MLQSLRFRLPALFLAGVLLAGIVSAAIAFRLLQSYSEDRSLKELRREAGGLTSLYAQQAIKSSDEGGIAPAFVGAELENATGDRIYYAGLPLFPGETAGLRRLPSGLIDWPAIRAGQSVTFEFTPPEEDRPYIAVGSPVALEGTTFGALVVAKPKTVLRDTWLTLMKFFAVSLLGGLVVAAGVAWWASRRITRPVLTLSRAADEIAEGRYDVAVPQLKGGDEISHLAQRFSDMAARLAEAEELERNFLMSVSHELRTPLTAIRGHLEAVREGVVHEPEAQAESLDVIAAETDRLERLVGDVLDLAKLDARRFTVLREEVDMGRLLDQAYASFGEEARRRGIEYRYAGEREARDHDRRRPRPPDHLQPAGERLPLDARRRDDRAGPRRRERRRLGRRRRLRPGHQAGRAGAHLPAVLVAGRRRHGSRPDDRAGARDGARRADRAREHDRRRAAASPSCCRRRLAA